MIDTLHIQLKTLFSPAHFGDIVQTGHITESGPQVTVDCVEVKTSGELFLIENSFQQSNRGLFNYRNQGTPLACDCDGVAAVELEGENYLVFIELKSSYTDSQIIKARKQLLTGYYNIMTQLNCTQVFHRNDFKCCCLIVSHPISDELLRRYMQWKQQDSIDGLHRLGLFFAMHKDEPALLCKTDVPEIASLPVSHNCLCDKIPLFHCEVPEGSSCVTINLDTLLHKL